ncbi:sensor histidine kinase [Clostridium sp. CF011]|nr:sensor histidine kinase [Clostridium sp. CF011]MBU3091412.1 sensor histidine kinase [Clostridium sp. CF011]
MDIKLKNSKSKYIINTIILLILIVVSLGMYSTYPNIKEAVGKHESNIFEGSDFLNAISNSNYGIYFHMLKNAENKDLEPSDVILKLDKKYDDYILQNMINYKTMFNEEIYGYKKNLDENLKNLEYYAIKKDSKIIEERSIDRITLLLNNNLSHNTIEKFNKMYSFYAVIDYDGSGKGTIKELYGADVSTVTQKFKNNKITSVSTLEMSPIKNMTYIYAVPKELKYNDLIVSYKENSEMNTYEEVAPFFITIALLFILAVALITPYRISKELFAFKKIAKIPIEMSSFIIFFTLFIIYNGTSYLLIEQTIKGQLINFSQIEVTGSVLGILVSVINILYWLICLGIIFIGVVIVKHIFKTGIRKYIRETSLTYKILRSLWIGNKRIYNYLKDIDLKEKNTKKLVMILGINFIILSIMSCMWFLGIIVAIIYNAILFVVIRKIYNEMTYKYNKLFEATNKIAEGNLDVTIEENLGVFNDFKKEIESIQKGFKKAVNQEVKSQKMKTELISNVSHDLKTPLTSIITYTDLLKDENLSAEKHKEYLDTLDRKSQRLQELIEDLFEVSKATSGNINLNLVDVDVVALMKQTLLELDDKISAASLVVKTKYPEGKVILHLDSQRMFRVFENLIINITKYSMKGSRVYIDIVSREDKIEITLKNMTAIEIEFNVNDIVERFVRGDKARNTEGSGLGLAIAKSFVELQGGQLNITVDGDLFKVTVTFN